MDQNKERLYTVGELAKRCGVTVRTLQYYDSEGLLSPKNYTEGGRRLYGREDIIKLQQILFLKSFGFSLEQIRESILQVESGEQMAGILKTQRELLLGQADKLRDMAEFLGKVIEEIGQNGYLSTEKLVSIMEIMKAGIPYSFVLRYFNKEAMQTFSKWVYGDTNMQGFGELWQSLFEKMMALYKQGVDPEGEEGQNLAKQWWDLVQKFTQNDPKMLQTLMQAGSDVDNWPDEAGEFKEAIKQFIGRALGKYLTEAGIMPEGV